MAGEVGEEGEERVRYIKCPISFMRVDCKRRWNLGLALQRKQPFVTFSNKHPYLRH